MSRALAHVCLFLAIALFAREQWTMVGPGVFGACYAPSVNPRNSQEMMYGTDMGALFLTRDGGKTWRAMGSMAAGGNPGYRGAWRSAFDPAVPNRLWCASEHGVFRSDDMGEHWRMTTEDGSPHGYYFLEFDPGNANVLYTGEGFPAPKHYQHGHLLRTEDAGEHWAPVATPDGTEGSTFTSMVVYPGEKIVILCGHRGIWESLDKGRSWISIRERFPFPSDSTPKFSSLLRSGDKLFAMILPFTHGTVNYGGLWESLDEGKTWHESALNAAMPEVKNTRHRGAAMGFMLAGSRNRVYVAIHPFGIIRSDDNGETWTKVLKSSAFWPKVNGSYYPSAKAGSNMDRTTNYGTDAMRAVAVSSSNPDVVMFTDNSSLTISVDGGKNWHDPVIDYVYPFDEGRFQAEVPTQLSWAIQSRGPQMIVCNKMMKDPHDTKIVYAAYWDHGFHVSRDGGKSWERPSRGLHDYNDLRGARSLTIDYRHPGRVYFTSCNPHGRAFVSEDYGKTFKDVSIKRQPKGREENKDVHSGIVIDPENSDHLFMTTDVGLFESMDRGGNWRDITPAIVKNYRHCRFFVMTEHGWYLSLEPKRNIPECGLLFSSDKGKNWIQVMPDILGGIQELVFCHSNPRIGYLVAYNTGESGTWVKRCLYKTIDAGRSWTEIYGPALLCGLDVHPNNPDVVYVASYASNLTQDFPEYLRSTDGGQKWNAISRDIPIDGRMASIHINPQNPSEVFFCDWFTVYRLIEL